jgi:thioredoxin 1
MSTVNLTEATFTDTIRDHDIVLGKVDTEAEQALAAQANITSIPTLMAFRGGVLVFAQPGAVPANGLEPHPATAITGFQSDLRRTP